MLLRVYPSQQQRQRQQLPPNHTPFDKTLDSCCDEMFEGFTFDQKGVGSRSRPDFNEVIISPKDVAPDWPPSEAAPAILSPWFTSPFDLQSQPRPEPIDSLVRQMSSQSLLSNPQSESRTATWILKNEPATIEVSSPIQEMSPPIEPLVPSITASPAVSHKDLRDSPLPNHNATGHDSVDDGMPMIEDTKNSPPQSDACAQSNTFNPRAVRESLMELMITHGLQCNVQTSTPTTPISACRPSLPNFTTTSNFNRIPCLAPIPRFTPLLQLGSDEPMGDTEMSLEVDVGYNEQEDDFLLNSLVSLRQAAAPGGIRRYGGLKYRRSAEIALQGKNMRRNEIKMRKRPKSKSAPSMPVMDAPMGTASV
jgi:hypothetical protein